jgi:hypothetical protein
MRLRRALLLTAAVWAAFAACSPAVPEGEEYSDARLMDELCRMHQCDLEGSARSIEGLTADSYAFELGPAAGRLSFQLSAALVSAADQVSVSALMKGAGYTSGGALRSEYAWLPIAFDPATQVASVEIAQGSHAVVADVRITRTYSSAGCE